MPKEENYQIIARKFRPQTFLNMVGQEAIVTTLKNALRSGKIAQAYLFCGSRGTGKTSFARLFAKALNCINLTPDFEPCNTCSSCIDIEKARSLNVIEIDGASNRGIDDIRQINETVLYATLSGKYKIYIIDEVHMLTKEAFNALLKTLEEPPANVKFFFATTEPHKILPTIISRCQRFDLNRLSILQIKNKLQTISNELGVTIEEEALNLIAKRAEGSLRDAESLLDQIVCFSGNTITLDLISSQLGILSQEFFFQLDHAIHSENLAFAFTFIETLFNSGRDISGFLNDLMEHFRTLLCLKFPTSALTPVFLSVNEKEAYLHSSSLYREETLLYILDYLITWTQKFQKTSFQRLYLEMILLHLIRSEKRITIDHLTKRLIELEGNKTSLSNEKSPETCESFPSQTIDFLPKEQAPPLRIETPPTNSLPPEKTIADEMKECEEAAIERNIEPKALKPKTSPSLEEKLLTAIKAKIDNPLPREQKIAPLPDPGLMMSNEPPEPLTNNQQKPKPTLTTQQKSKYDTIIRFAAVELEGTVQE